MVERIVQNPKDITALKNVFQFGPLILAKPDRGGANRNLSTVLTKRV